MGNNNFVGGITVRRAKENEKERKIKTEQTLITGASKMMIN